MKYPFLLAALLLCSANLAARHSDTDTLLQPDTLFHIVPENSTHTALLLAGGFALTGAVVSITRIRLPLPEGLTRRRK